MPPITYMQLLRKRDAGRLMSPRFFHPGFAFSFSKWTACAVFTTA